MAAMTSGMIAGASRLQADRQVSRSSEKARQGASVLPGPAQACASDSEAMSITKR